MGFLCIYTYSTGVAVFVVIVFIYFFSPTSVASLPRWMSPCHLRGGYLSYIKEVEKDASSVKPSERGCLVALFLEKKCQPEANRALCSN